MVFVDLRAIRRGGPRDRLSLARKSTQAARGLLLHIMTHISLIQSPIPVFFGAPEAVFCLAPGGS